MRFSLCFLFLSIVVQFGHCQSSSTDEEFHATDQWQIVREGQKISPGLHVRLNLETGLREAKLLDPNDQPSQSNSLVPVSSEPTQEEISRQNLEEAFAQLDLSKDDVQVDQKHIDEIRQKYRSYEELKKDFEDLQLKIQTDQEIIRQLIDQLNQTNNVHDQRTILTDLEYYLHQYDNAIFFADVNGLNLLINLLNSSETDVEIRQLISLTLGAAFQGNPQVQLKGIHLGFLQSLLRLIHLESNENLRFRLFYPLSTLLRNFPQAQRLFLDYGGPEMMMNIIDLNNANQKLAMRVINLMNDLIIEKIEARDAKRAAYENLHLSEQLVERGWCLHLVHRLKSLEIDDFDSIEKMINALIPLKELCRDDFQSLSSLFDQIHQIYTTRNDSIYTEFLAQLEILRDFHSRRSNEDL